MKIADDFAAIAASVKKLHEPGTKRSEETVTLSICALDSEAVATLLRKRLEQRPIGMIGPDTIHARFIDTSKWAEETASAAASKACARVAEFGTRELAGYAAGTAFAQSMIVSKTIADEIRAFFGCDGE